MKLKKDEAELLVAVDGGNVSVYGVKPSFGNKNLIYKIVRSSFQSSLRDKIRKRFKTWFNEEFNSKKISDYSPNGVQAETVPVCSSTLYGIEEKVKFFSSSVNVESWDEKSFFKSGYIMIEYFHNSEKVFVVSKCPGGWNLNKKIVFNVAGGGKLKLNKENQIMFNDIPSFVVFRGKAYVFNKYAFEQFFQIEDGLRAQVDDICEDDVITSRIDNVEKFGEVVKSRRRYMNMLSDAYQKGYCRKENFWKKVEECVSKRKWKLVFHDGMIQLDKCDIEDLLYVLKDGKVMSELTDNEYNMDTGSKSNT